MYRPTVRYDESFRSYVNAIFHATHLDRNQIIRAALFAAAYSKEFRELLDPFKKKNAPFPFPEWTLNDNRYWMEQSIKENERGKDVNVNDRRTEKTSEAPYDDSRRGSEPDSERFEQVTGRERKVPTERIRIANQGGITFTFN
ncbi:hypothetical protein [Bacillus sp. S/N-304-OC-R1]|uniref:hypothetical protein n=1 Tax=Bacillus sp. S/N-304-OC-R1 TaxID=2758034 RepID=UPI001C8D74FA|nr:hypothetical protein [Bacillus sp. S/N-304-OC-R1]MBY0124505.1 hypothetical protein [Bacillus sp. S/N-304-OC-R1]